MSAATTATISSRRSRSSDGDKATELLSEQPPGRSSTPRTATATPALIIAIARSDEDWTGFLLNKGADPNLAGKGGDTPLIAAARVGFDEAVEWLLGLGAKVDATNRMGETPLIVAVQQRQTPHRPAAARGRRQPRQDRYCRRAIRRATMRSATLALATSCS